MDRISGGFKEEDGGLDSRRKIEPRVGILGGRRERERRFSVYLFLLDGCYPQERRYGLKPNRAKTSEGDRKIIGGCKSPLSSQTGNLNRSRPRSDGLKSACGNALSRVGMQQD
jgi:hypothetical protein